ncbi:hypothetical protein VPNG_04579 [Cytospora leucostoma]|uniref:Stress-response A/B barrel domain-containing protein n=1 Tax=Cytospora leucostoma TaxID=1230097 RepID=A0A423XCJ0_9PEZI|nr:hypothetical protein VPNG_04579 [Cytospora leucostoma]
MSKLIHRITLFKIPGAENQAKALAAYEKLAKEQKKDGKPYIAYLSAGIAQEDARNKGYTVVAQSKFFSQEDQKFYDESCTAHQELKATVKTLKPEEPPLTVYFEGEPAIDLTKA